MNFIKRVFDKKINEETHLQFQKFSKGEFINREIIEAKNSNGKYTIKTSYEFANELIREFAQKIIDERVNINGAIVSTSDLTGKVNFKDKKQFQGVKTYVIEGEMTGREIINLLDEFPKAFFGFSFDAKENSLKIKAKAPKSGKPGKGDEAPKADFCTLKTTDKKLVESFVFEKPDFKTAEIKHKFIIDTLILPKDEKDYAKIRELAIRKGKIIRESLIDDEKKTIEFELEA